MTPSHRASTPVRPNEISKAVFDDENVESLRDQTGDDPDSKISLLLSFAGEDREIDDPYYSGKYEKAFGEIYRGCEALLKKLTGE